MSSMAVVFPAPFGPTSPITAPSGTARSAPSRALTCPYLLSTPSNSMIMPPPPPM